MVFGLCCVAEVEVDSTVDELPGPDEEVVACRGRAVVLNLVVCVESSLVFAVPG